MIRRGKKPGGNIPREARAALAGAQQTRGEGYLPGMLYLERWGNLTSNLTPSRLKAILAAADNGDIAEQHKLFADMEDRCDHLAAEMGKRRRALLTLNWSILPGGRDREAEYVADAVREQFDLIPDFEDLIQNLADGIGHGFAALEAAWGYEEGIHIPCYTHRPQSWFSCLRTDLNELRLRDGSADGAALWPFGWAVHRHASKSGWLPRHGLFRVLAWTYLIRSYAQEANIGYVQVHGMPLRLGKYPPGSSREDRQALMQALRYLGRDAAGIIPAGMEIVFQTPSNATQDIPGQLVERCERGMSKAVLGGTLTTQADGKTSTNALGSVHNEVRHDLLVSDAQQIATTITRQILAPLAYLNLGVTDRRLLPYFVFDTREAADIAVYADALPKLVGIMDISKAWAHDTLRIPQAESEDDILGAEYRAGKSYGEDRGNESPDRREETRVAAKAGGRESGDGDNAQTALDDIGFDDEALTEAAEKLLAPLLEEVRDGLAPEELEERLASLYPAMDEAQLADMLARVLFVARVWGRINAE